MAIGIWVGLSVEAKVALKYLYKYYSFLKKVSLFPFHRIRAHARMRRVWTVGSRRR